MKKGNLKFIFYVCLSFCFLKSNSHFLNYDDTNTSHPEKLNNIYHYSYHGVDNTIVALKNISDSDDFYTQIINQQTVIFNSDFVKYSIPLLIAGKNKYIPKYFVKYQYFPKITGNISSYIFSDTEYSLYF